jgi:acetyl-CoA carboxylase carboxyl transferase subunit alpha
LATYALDFEKPLLELEQKLAELKRLAATGDVSGDTGALDGEIRRLERRCGKLQQEIFQDPEGYRKALRLMKLAERFDRPVIAFIDTPGAYPGIDAEERGQAEAIAVCLEEMAALQVPVISVVIGEGGSGGALAIGVCNRLLMLQYSWYSVISPESCAAILYRDASKGEKAAEALKLTARDAYELGIVDELVEEAPGGAHRDPDATAQNLAAALRRHLRDLSLMDPEGVVEDRYQKFRKLGPVTSPVTQNGA